MVGSWFGTTAMITVTPAMYELQWFPIAERIKFVKTRCVLVHHAVNGRAPSKTLKSKFLCTVVYLTELVTRPAISQDTPLSAQLEGTIWLFRVRGWSHQSGHFSVAARRCPSTLDWSVITTEQCRHKAFHRETNNVFCLILYPSCL